jgi:hypothetical protein
MRHGGGDPGEDAGQPEPLDVPIAVHAPFHLIDVDEAWAFAGHDTQRWTLATGARVLLPVEMAHDLALSLRFKGHPTSFAATAT